MTYNSDQTIELLQRAVAEKGDGYIYPGSAEPEFSCRYTDEETQAPSCIVGHVLGYLELLSEAEEHKAADRLGVVRKQFTKNSAPVLRAAQILQDKGLTWGEALIAAKDASCSSDPAQFVKDMEAKFYGRDVVTKASARLNGSDE